MSSREIAELTGKMHKDVLKSIRSMEPAWVKINGRNFSLVEYTDSKGERRPVYELTKTECLYIATKFNDEARAILILRWEELETNNLNSSERIELENYRSSAKQRLIKSSRIKELDFLIKEQMKERDLLRKELNIIDRNDYQQLTLLGFDLNSIDTERKFLEKINY